MCVLCGELVMNVHWTDQPIHDKEYRPTAVVGESQRDRIRNRLCRADFVNNIVAFYGLSFRDWQGSKYVLSDRKGQQKIINDLGDLWPAAQQMSGRRIDPLDPALLSYLSAPECCRHEHTGSRCHAD